MTECRIKYVYHTEKKPLKKLTVNSHFYLNVRAFLCIVKMQCIVKNIHKK